VRSLHSIEPRQVEEHFLTLAEAAEVLRLSTRTVRKYLKQGDIRGKIIGNRWKFKRADLDAFFESAPLTGISLENTATGIRRFAGISVFA
jgi:excisionase family DNA binding protein